MTQQSKSHNEPFLSGMNIFFIVVAIFIPVFTEIHRYYIRSVNPRVDYSFSDFITVLTLCFIYLFGVLFDVLHRQHKRIKALELQAKAAKED